MEVEKISDLDEIYFPKLGWRFHISPTAFTIGNFEIQWYGLIITFGLLMALIYCFPKMRRFGIDADRAVDAVIGGVLGGVIGARLYYVLFNLDEYKKGSAKETLKEMVNIRGGGLAIYGGIIGALCVGLLVCKWRKVKMLPMLDITVLGFLIGQGIGRWGNFTNQEAFGENTSNFLGMTGGKIQDTIIAETSLGGSMYAHDQATVMWEKTVHPCFLYESLWCLLGFVILAWFSKRRKYDGQILLMYLTWYGAERSVVEGLRTDSLYIGNSNLRVSQVLSIVLVVLSVILQIILFFRYRRDPESFVLYANTEESHRLIEESKRKRMGMSLEDARASLGDDDDDDFDDVFDDDDDFDDDEDDEVSAPTILGDDDGEDDDTAAEAIAETAGEKAEEAVETAEEKAEEAVEAVEEKAEEAVETAGEKAEEIAEAAEEKAEEAVETAEDKYEDLAEELDEKLRGGSGKGPHNKKKRNR